MSAPRKAKTEFGIEVRVFTAQTGMTVKELAEKAGVKYTTLVETTTGRCAGHQLIPTVRRFMATYPQTEAGQSDENCQGHLLLCGGRYDNYRPLTE